MGIIRRVLKWSASNGNRFYKVLSLQMQQLPHFSLIVFHELFYKISHHVTYLQEDLYYPHPLLQDILWASLDKVVEPILTCWPGKKLRAKALHAVMEHIHYEDENTRYICIGPVNKVFLRHFLQVICILLKLEFYRIGYFKNLFQGTISQWSNSMLPVYFFELSFFFFFK